MIVQTLDIGLYIQLNTVDILSGGHEALVRANVEWGLALAEDEIAYLVDAYTNILKRNPTDVELLMFAQVHSLLLSSFVTSCLYLCLASTVFLFPSIQ